MNKILAKMCIFSLLIFLVFTPTSVYAEKRTPNDWGGGGGSRKTTSTSNDDWISDAFKAVKSFFNEDVKDDLGIVATPLDLFRNIVKAINRVLLVFLAGISVISLSIVGIRYLMSTNDAKQKGKAKEALHTTFKGMAFGFGAFFIWRIAMGIVEVIISNL